MPPPRVLVLHNEPTLPPGHPDAESETDVLDTADAVSRILRQAGLNPLRLSITDDPTALLAGLKAAAPDVVFNLYEGTAKWGNAEGYVSGVLELLRLPYTGSPTQPLLLCRSKPLTKRLLAGAGLPTPPYFLVEDGTVPPCPLRWPVIVKPGAEDASIGIDQDSVVTNQRQLEDRVAYLRDRYGPSVLVERFVRGREFQVAVVERGGPPAVLPFTEILFVPPADAPDLWPIVSFDAKWREHSREFHATPAKNPADNVSPDLQTAVAGAVRKAFELVGCRDYGRVDVRVDEEGNPFILEVNPNPCISQAGGVGVALETAKIAYPDFILGLVRNALRRGPKQELADAISSATPIPAAPEHAQTADERFSARPARLSDWEAIAGLIAAAGGWSAAEREAITRRVSEGLGHPDRDGWRCLVLAWEGELAGCACVRPADDLGGFALEFLTVAPALRRAGRGRALLRAVEAVVAAAGGRALLAALTSAPGFADGRQFLIRTGFQSAGEVADFTPHGYSRLTYARPVKPTAAPPGPASPPMAGAPP